MAWCVFLKLRKEYKMLATEHADNDYMEDSLTEVGTMKLILVKKRLYRSYVIGLEFISCS
jgi:hypothetical protein